MITELEWRLIGDSVKTGRYNLLLGAGVSLDSLSGIPGESCPSAGRLAELLQVALPGVRRGSSLSRLYRSMNSDQIEKMITHRFKQCISGPTVKAITQFRWKRIFTLNVDDALEHAYETQAVATQLHRTYNFNDDYESVRDVRTLPIIHLHGWARQSDQGYIFDLSEYARSMARNNIWAHVLSELIRTEPFIVLGTSLEEPDLAFFMAQRGETEVRRDAPPSIFVEPFPDDGTIKDCDTFRMRLYKGTASVFLNEVASRFPVRPSITETLESNLGDIAQLPIDSTNLAEFHADFERVPGNQLFGSDGGTNFAYGHQASWLDIQNGRDLVRDETASLQAALLTADSLTLTLIDGGPGAGKSTLLRRIAWNLAQSGRTCLWLKALGRIRLATAETVLKAINGRTYIFVDNFADSAVDIAGLRERLKGQDVVFVGAERTYRLVHVKRAIGAAITKSVSLLQIGRRLKVDLVQIYTNYGLATSLNLDRVILPLEGELIAVACCRILSNFEPLSTIIDRSLRHAPSDIDCYIFAALAAHCHRQGIEFNIISAQFPNYQVDRQLDRDGPLPLKLETIADVEFITPLNEAVSDSVLRRFASQAPAQMLNSFKKLAASIASRVSPRTLVNGEPSARIASRLFDYDEVTKPLLGVSGSGDFLDTTKSAWQWNSRYWQQRAQYQLDVAGQFADVVDRRQAAEVAVQHARFARTIEPHHQFTMTNIGRTLFGKMRLLGMISGQDLAEAIDALGRAIVIERRAGRVTVHPFVILFQGLTDALSMGAILSQDQRSTVRSHLDRATEAFPRDPDIVEKVRRVRALL